MTRHQQRQLVRGAGLRDGTHGSRLAERGGDVAIARGAARRDLLQGAPHPRLERRAADIERQVGLLARPGDEAHDPLGPAGQHGVGRHQLGLRKALAQFGFEAGAVVAERGHADAALGGGDECLAERGRDHREADPLTRAAAAPRAGGHAEPVRCRRIGARAGAEAGAIDRRGDRLAGIEPLGEAVEAICLAPFARCRAGDLLEHAMKMEPAETCGGGQFGKGRQRVAGADQGAGPADRRDMPVGRRALIRPAALAGAEAGGLGHRSRLVERDILAARLSRGAARPAIDPGRLDRIKEIAVLRRVVCHDGRPALLLVHPRHSVTRHGANVAAMRECLYPAIAF